MKCAPVLQLILPFAMLLGTPAPGQHSVEEDPVHAAEKVAKNPRFQSAAIAGRFKAMPPSPHGFPIQLLMEMRVKLGGEPLPQPAAATSAPKLETNGH